MLVAPARSLSPPSLFISLGGVSRWGLEGSELRVLRLNVCDLGPAAVGSGRGDCPDRQTEFGVGLEEHDRSGYQRAIGTKDDDVSTRDSVVIESPRVLWRFRSLRRMELCRDMGETSPSCVSGRVRMVLDDEHEYGSCPGFRSYSYRTLSGEGSLGIPTVANHPIRVMPAAVVPPTIR